MGRQTKEDKIAFKKYIAAKESETQKEANRLFAEAKRYLMAQEIKKPLEQREPTDILTCCKICSNRKYGKFSKQCAECTSIRIAPSGFRVDQEAFNTVMNQLKKEIGN